MSGELGPATWPDAGGFEAFSLGFALDGQFVDGGAVIIPAFLQSSVGPSLLTTITGRDIQQRRSIGGDQPLSVRPYSSTFSFQVEREPDMWLFEEIAKSGRVARLFLDLPEVDVWHIPSANVGQTLWRTSRVTSWGVVGSSQASRPVRVFIDSTEQTVLDSGVPAAGQVTVADPGLNTHMQVETPGAGISGNYLILRYVPQLEVSMRALSKQHRQHNDYRFVVSVRELFRNTYTGVSV